MALDNHLFAAVAEAVADIAAHLGIGIIDVHIVHPVVKGAGHELTGGGGINILEAAAAEADDTHTQAGAAQCAVLHIGIFNKLFFLVTRNNNEGQTKEEKALEKKVVLFFHCKLIS